MGLSLLARTRPAWPAPHTPATRPKPLMVAALPAHLLQDSYSLQKITRVRGWKRGDHLFFNNYIAFTSITSEKIIMLVGKSGTLTYFQCVNGGHVSFRSPLPNPGVFSLNISKHFLKPKTYFESERQEKITRK